jgi:hypothetical protein
MAIQRAFNDIAPDKISEADQQSCLTSLGWSRASGWADILRSKRILIISEAGAGKTYECREQRQRLWDAGEPAFLLELATLASSDVRTMLDHEEERRLDAWLTSQSDVATFFLDSIDELKLSLGSVEQALKRLRKAIGGQLARVRIVITTRPVPFDEQLIRRLLNVPTPPEAEVTGETFAQVAMGKRPDRDKKEDDAPAEWRTVALMPLSDAQIADFARGQGIADTNELLEDLRRRNAQDFARRPQDLLELCADWRDFKRIRTHREQVMTNVRVKLKPREDRPEPAELSVDKAIEGASRLALAMINTRRFTIRHSAEADAGHEDVAQDPAIILSDWTAPERKALLERPLFGFASYGRVRFHHRSVMEFLAAERVRTLRAHGMTVRALKRLLFAITRGKTIARPSKSAIAGWLALDDDTVFEMLRDHEPDVLLTYGDPESLSLPKRAQALRAYVKRYGDSGWRGLSVPHIQIHRFATLELANEIKRLWAEGIANTEIREILLRIIETGRIAACSDLAYTLAIDPAKSHVERTFAVEALAQVNDPRLDALSASIADDAALWPDQLARNAILRLYPQHMSTERLCKVLARVQEKKRAVGDLSWQLPRLISEVSLDQGRLAELRDGLTPLLKEGFAWQDNWPHIKANRPHLANAMAATCVKGLAEEITPQWLAASALAKRLPRRDTGSDEPLTELKKILAGISAEDNAILFWGDAALIDSIHQFTTPFNRYATLAVHGPTTLDPMRDRDWIERELADPHRSEADRAMLLEAAFRMDRPNEKWSDYVLGLKAHVADQPALLARIDDRLKPSADNDEMKKWAERDARRQKVSELRDAKNKESWVEFWREIANNPETVFADDRRGNTAWNLWRAMSQAGDESRESGWNRRFIEAAFDKETADRLRLALMKQWREDRPTLSSERADDERNTYLVRWQIGLAAIYAEAEDPDWAAKLTPDEAQLAARYAPIELNGLPHWLEALVFAHPDAVNATLGKELSAELETIASPNWHSMLLQSVGHSPPAVAKAFLPRLRVWLDANGDRTGRNEDSVGAANRLQRIVDILIKHGDDATRQHLRDIADQRLKEDIPTSVAYVWLPVLMRLDANAGIDALERRLADVEPAARSEGVNLIATLFGDRSDAIYLSTPSFSPAALLRLLRLSYQHVRRADDVEHDGVYSPDARDNAERGRNEIVGVLFKAKGEEGWAAKLAMAEDPLCADFRDRIIAVAEEQWAEEVDATALDDAQAVALDKTGEAAPLTGPAMFSIMLDRLEDIDDLLLRDMSPREAWAAITEEKVMRREIAREMKNLAHGLYTVDQEAVTADEKETDVRLRSTGSPFEATIELKLADGRTARDLRDTLKDQLVTKYMAAETSRSGCLLVTIAKDRKWDHPETGERVNFDTLVALLKAEAKRIEESMGNTVQLHVHAISLLPRLPSEAKKSAAR